MAKEEKNGGGGVDAVKDLKYFLLILLILGFVWLFAGGPFRPESKSGFFLRKPQQKAQTKAANQVSKIFGIQTPALPGLEEDTGDGSTNAKEGNFAGQKNNSASSVSVKIPEDILKINAARAKETDINKEYIEVSAPKSNKKPVRLTGLKLKGKIGLDIAIGQGAYLVFPSVDEQPKQDVYLNPGEKAIIITGSSPLGTSFRLNKCMGYMNQFHKFEPKLPSDCPRPKDEDLPNNLNDQCLDYLNNIPACKTFISIPSNLSSVCQTYLNDKINYKTCFELHQHDADFYGAQWRIYLGRSDEMWKKSRETISLTRADGNIIDSESY